MDDALRPVGPESEVTVGDVPRCRRGGGDETMTISDWTKVTRPIPVSNEWTKPFWDAAREGVLALQRCQSCRHFQHPQKGPRRRVELPPGGPTPITARIGRSLLTTRSRARHPSVPALSRRAHGDHRLAPFTASASAARATVGMSPTHTAAATPLRRPLASPRLAARAAIALTLPAASVIVVSSTLKPAPRRNQAHARLLSTLSHPSQRRAPIPTRYKSPSIAL